MDRITRSVAELEQVIDLMERTGASIVTSMGDLDLTTANGRMVARILGAVARAEVELKTARMQLANQERASQGRRPRTSPRLFGYNADGTVNPVEAEAVRQAASDVLSGLSLYAVAKRWTGAGLLPDSRARKSPELADRAPAWSIRGVKDCLSNPRHAGLAVYQGAALDGVKGDWEAILDEETHISLKALFADPSRRIGDHRRGRKPGEQLLSTVARCGKKDCERTISASKRNGVPMYVCRDGHVTIPVHKVDMVITAELARGIASVAMAGHFVVDEPGEVNTGELEVLRERMDALAEPYAEGAITLTQFMTATKALRERIAAVEEAIASGSTNARTLSAEEALEIYLSASVEGKRQLLKSGFDITIDPVGKGQRVDPLKQVKMVPRQAN